MPSFPKVTSYDPISDELHQFTEPVFERTSGGVISTYNDGDDLLMQGFITLDKIADATGIGDYSLSWALEFKTSTWDGGATDESIYMQGLPSDFFTKPEPGLGFQWSGVTRFILSVDGMYYIPDLSSGDDSYFYGAAESGVGKGCSVTFKGGDTTDGNNDGGDIYLDAGQPAGTGDHGIVIIKKEGDATAGDTAVPSNTFRFISSYWNGSAAVDTAVTIRAEPISAFFANAAFYINADGDDVFAIDKGDFIAVTPYDLGGGDFRMSYGVQYQSVSGVNAPIVNIIGGACANGTPGPLRFVPGYDVASGTTAPIIFGATGYGNQDLVFDFYGSVNSGQFSWMNDEDYFSFADAVKVDRRMIRSKSVYTGTDTIDDVYLHRCNSGTAFTLTVTDGANDGEEIVIENIGAGLVTLSGNINSDFALTTLNYTEEWTYRWNSTAGEWQ